MLVFVYFCIILLLIYVSAATFYLIFLAAAYFFADEPRSQIFRKRNIFAILVPAHNEELLISGICKSLLQIDYPRESYEIFVIADNCADQTSSICRSYQVNVLERNDSSKTGKGYAINWGLKQIPLETFDAVFMVDADNVVDPGILQELDSMLNMGERVVQCNNSVRNPDDSWFTRLLYVSRTICNLLYHHSKYKLGLSSYLMGNGLCFKADLLIKKGWTAFSEGEDWEYYARLIQDKIKIGFAVKARVFHQESRSLKQATSQRLRWSSGRFKIARKFGVPLFLRGLRDRDLFTVDASLPLILPNYSLLVNLTILALGLCALLPHSSLRSILSVSCAAILFGQALIFSLGAWLAGSLWKTCIAVLNIPKFLIWKLIIDLFTVTGIYKGNKWVRTDRHISR